VLLCTDPLDEEEDDRPSKRKKKKSKDKLHQRYLDGGFIVEPLGEDEGKYQFMVFYGPP